MKYAIAHTHTHTYEYFASGTLLNGIADIMLSTEAVVGKIKQTRTRREYDYYVFQAFVKIGLRGATSATRASS